jgi:hypothetical protein
VALCQQADFEATALVPAAVESSTESKAEQPAESVSDEPSVMQPLSKMSVGALQYHVNIVLPESRDQGVYDAIFKSLRQHLG